MRPTAWSSFGPPDQPFRRAGRTCPKHLHALRFTLLNRESTRAAEQQASGFEEKLSRAAVLLLRSDPDEFREAAALLEDAIAERPEDSMALAMSACVRIGEVMVGWRDVSPEDLDAAKREATRALDLNPYYTLGLWGMGLTEILAGDYGGGAQRCEAAASLDASFDSNHRLLSAAALGRFAAQDYERALANAQHSDERFRDVPRTLLALTAAAMHLGQQDLAHRTVERIRSKYPSVVVADIGAMPFRDPEPRERFLDALRQAGLPTE